MFRINKIASKTCRYNMFHDVKNLQTRKMSSNASSEMKVKGAAVFFASSFALNSCNSVLLSSRNISLENENDALKKQINELKEDNHQNRNP